MNKATHCNRILATVSQELTTELSARFSYAEIESPRLKKTIHGKQILVTPSRQLTAEYGRGFSYAEIESRR